MTYVKILRSFKALGTQRVYPAGTIMPAKHQMKHHTIPGEVFIITFLALDRHGHVCNTSVSFKKDSNAIYILNESEIQLYKLLEK